MASAQTHEALFPSFARLQLRDARRASTPVDASFEASRSTRPDAPRRSTDPPLDALLQASQPVRPRTRSPFARGHLRSQSAQTLSAPPMARTRSLPTVTFSHFPGSSTTPPMRPSSPLRPLPAPRGSPRRSFEETRPPSSGAGFTEIESIAEDSEADFSPRTLMTPASPTPMAPNSASFQRSNSGRRRPASPLQQQATFPDPGLTSSPQSLAVSRFNEPFPSASSSASFTYSAGSSIPSTPTSLRSRSPSISSLDTIADSPDAEEEAAEAHHLARLKAAADAAEAAEMEAETKRKLRAVGVEAPAMARPVTWSPQSLKEKRKRWSVCGAERRADFEMETIWED